MDANKISSEIAALKRAVKEAATASLKDKIKNKIKSLEQALNDLNISAKRLAILLLGAKRKVEAYSASEFNSVIKRLSNKAEYSFLKGLTKSEIKDDIKREAKKPGWRFKGRDNFKTPTKKDIIKDAGKPFSKRKTYYEARSNRSDVVRPVKLSDGGEVNLYELFYDEPTGSIMTKKGNYYVGRVLDNDIIFDSNNGAVKDINKDIVIKLWKDGKIKEQEKVKYNEGGEIKNDYVIKGNFYTPQHIWKEWNKSQKTHFLLDHIHDGDITAPQDVKDNWRKFIDYDYKDLPAYVKDEIQKHLWSGQYSKGGGVNKYKVGDIVGNTAQGFNFKVINFSPSSLMVEDLKTGRQFETFIDNMYKSEYSKGGAVSPYIIWVSKDGDKRELYGEYKSQRAAKTAMDKLWDKGEYNSMGYKLKSEYEKNGFYKDGGEVEAEYDSVYEIHIKQGKDGVPFYAIWDKIDGVELGHFAFKTDAENWIKSKKHYAKGGNVSNENSEMVKSYNKQIAHHSKEMKEAMKKDSDIPAWVVAKMTRSASDLSDATHYMEGKGEKYAKGGGVKYYNKENERLARPSGSIEKEVLEKVTFKDAINEKYFVGNFGWKTTQGKLGDGYLYKLDEYDQNLVKDIKLKTGEKVFRYVNRSSAIGGMSPLVKINLDKGLLYFPIHNDNDDIAFESKGVSALWISIIEDKMAKGGGLEEEGIDLFEDYENIPPKVQKILDKYEHGFIEGNYNELEKALKELKKVGYTFEYYLDGQAYDLRPIGTEVSKKMKNGGNIKAQKLNLVFSREDVFEKAKDFYENESGFYPADVNDEVRTFVFDIENGEADVTEYYLEQELEETDLDGYYFEVVDEYAKGGGVKLKAPNTVKEFRDKMNDFSKRMATAESMYKMDNGKAYRKVVKERDEYYSNSRKVWMDEVNKAERNGQTERYKVLMKMISEAFTLYKKGGEVSTTKAQQNKVAKVMNEFKHGDLHIGKSNKIVKNKKQAMAIALSENRKGWKHKK